MNVGLQSCTIPSRSAVIFPDLVARSCTIVPYQKMDALVIQISLKYSVLVSWCLSVLVIQIYFCISQNSYCGF